MGPRAHTRQRCGPPAVPSPPPRRCCAARSIRRSALCVPPAITLRPTAPCAPAVRRCRPQLTFVSAGFDAHVADPLASILLSARGYYEIASLVRGLAAELCEGRLVYALEGGYDLTAIAWSARACVDTLLGN